ncbi:hypothetical protein KCP74_24785 [Salmonella enterica subsp. enterica]|nr:hypothetical protein KCP74_24785 [Salmonella enterica subsp. enterica]
MSHEFGRRELLPMSCRYQDFQYLTFHISTEGFTPRLVLRSMMAKVCDDEAITDATTLTINLYCASFRHTIG